jgi:hypothetical protein
MRHYLIAMLAFCVVTLSSCSREPTVWITERTYLGLPSNWKAADTTYATVRSQAELNAALKRFPSIARPNFLSEVDFSRDVVILCTQADITRVDIDRGGMGLTYIKPNPNPGIGMAIATGKDVGKLGKFIEDTQ